MNELIINMQSTVDSVDPLASTFVAGFLGLWIIGLLINCLVGLFMLFSAIIFIIALIDIIQRENWKSENDKIIWLLLVIFVPLAQFYYYFITRKKLDEKKS